MGQRSSRKLLQIARPDAFPDVGRTVGLYECSVHKAEIPIDMYCTVPWSYLANVDC